MPLTCQYNLVNIAHTFDLVNMAWSGIRLQSGQFGINQHASPIWSIWHNMAYILRDTAEAFNPVNIAHIFNTKSTMCSTVESTYQLSNYLTIDLSIIILFNHWLIKLHIHHKTKTFGHRIIKAIVSLFLFGLILLGHCILIPIWLNLTRPLYPYSYLVKFYQAIFILIPILVKFYQAIISLSLFGKT
jgi:hypothetical protein